TPAPLPTHPLPLHDALPISSTNGEYRKLAFLRRPLKYNFGLAMTLVLLVSALAAVWGAMFSARRFVAPIQALVAGTRAVAKGDRSEEHTSELQSLTNLVCRL